MYVPRYTDMYNSIVAGKGAVIFLYQKSQNIFLLIKKPMNN